MLDSSLHPWLAHYPTNVDWHADIPQCAVHERLDRAEKLYPQHIALDFKGKTMSYAELAQKVRRFARGLHELGVGKGSRVGLFLPNSPHYVIAYYGILRAGATVVNYNPLYSARELEHEINDSGTELMVTLNLNMLYHKLQPLVCKSALKRIIVGYLTDALPPAKAALFTLAKAGELAHPPRDARHIHWDEMMDHPDSVRTAHINPTTDIAVLQYTGGTTGTPKGVVLTHGNLTANIRQARLWFPDAEDGKEVMMGVLPFFHVFAMTVVLNFSIAGGYRIILHPRFELKTLLHDIQHKRPTFMPGVPTMYSALLNYKKLDKYDLSSLKMCFSGGAPLPEDVKTRFEKTTGCVLVEGYGLSETSPIVAANPIKGVNKSGSIGVPLPGTIIEIICPDTGTPQPTGSIGELCIQGAQVMQGYYNRPEETANTLKNGRLHTGDLGYMDEEGYIFIVDRLKEMIISGGYNVYPRNIEELLYQHPDVVEAAVIGLPHATRGQVPKAYVALKDNATTTAQELKDFLRDKLSAYAMPAEIELRASLPKSPIGKILKKELLAEL